MAQQVDPKIAQLLSLFQQFSGPSRGQPAIVPSPSPVLAQPPVQADPGQLKSEEFLKVLDVFNQPGGLSPLLPPSALPVAPAALGPVGTTGQTQIPAAPSQAAVPQQASLGGILQAAASLGQPQGPLEVGLEGERTPVAGPGTVGLPEAKAQEASLESIFQALLTRANADPVTAGAQTAQDRVAGVIGDLPSTEASAAVLQAASASAPQAVLPDATALNTAIASRGAAPGIAFAKVRAALAAGKTTDVPEVATRMERIAALLGGAAAGARGATTRGEFFLGAGAGAVAGTAEIKKSDRDIEANNAAIAKQEAMTNASLEQAIATGESETALRQLDTAVNSARSAFGMALKGEQLRVQNAELQLRAEDRAAGRVDQKAGRQIQLNQQKLQEAQLNLAAQRLDLASAGNEFEQFTAQLSAFTALTKNKSALIDLRQAEKAVAFGIAKDRIGKEPPQAIFSDLLQAGIVGSNPLREEGRAAGRIRVVQELAPQLVDENSSEEDYNRVFAQLVRQDKSVLKEARKNTAIYFRSKLAANPKLMQELMLEVTQGKAQPKPQTPVQTEPASSLQAFSTIQTPLL